jgi:DUF1016 N-terminal domain
MPILSTLLRELPWSSHLHVLSRSKLAEEREFYLRMAKQEQWSVREVARQIATQLFARAILQPPKLSAAQQLPQISYLRLPSQTSSISLDPCARIPLSFNTSSVESINALRGTTMLSPIL